MEKVRKIHELENPLVDSMKELFQKAYPPALGYTLDYYHGEEEGTDRGVLVFVLNSTMLGEIYRKQMRLPKHIIREEVETDFIGKILTDFVMLGTTLITNNIMIQRAINKDVADGILIKPYSKGRLNNINLN